MKNVLRRLPWLAALLLLQPPAAPAAERGPAWRGARWGMTVEQVLQAFPGEASRIEPEVKLADGNAIAAGIERHAVDGEDLRVRFVFTAGKLALVSLRTQPERHATPELYARFQKVLAGQLGGPGEETRDDNFIDMRQVRWNAGRTRVDLKFIPGVVVILYSPLPQGGG